MAHVLATTGDAGRVFDSLARRYAVLTRQDLKTAPSARGIKLGFRGTEQRPEAGVATDPRTQSAIAVNGAPIERRARGGSSAERLLQRLLVEAHGSVAGDLDGAFTLLFADGRDGSLTVITDLGGNAHLYFRQASGGWLVSTSPRVLAPSDKDPFNAVAAHEFFSMGIVFETRSLWRDVTKIGPATVLRIDSSGNLSQRRYWGFEGFSGVRFGLRESSALLGEALADGMHRLHRQCPNVLADLTGGYDSRAAVAGLLKAGLPFSTTVSGNADDPDVIVSTAIAQALGIDHRVEEPPSAVGAKELLDALALTEGECELVEYSRVAAIHRRHAARGHQASINGSYGELARGYWWELLFPSIGAERPLDSLKLASKRFAAAPCDQGVVAVPLRRDLVAHMKTVIDRSVEPLRDKPNTLQMDHAYFDLRMQRWQGRIGSCTSRIWPCFSPFMFRSPLEIMLETRPGARLRSLLIRQLLSDHAPKLAGIRLEHGYPAMPATVWNLHRFTPAFGHYAGRIWRKVSRTRSLMDAAVSSPQFDVLQSLGLARAEDWLLAGLPQWHGERLAELVRDTERAPMSLALRRLLTLELAMRSVRETAAHVMR